MATTEKAAIDKNWKFRCHLSQLLSNVLVKLLKSFAYPKFLPLAHAAHVGLIVGRQWLPWLGESTKLDFGIVLAARHGCGLRKAVVTWEETGYFKRYMFIFRNQRSSGRVARELAAGRSTLQVQPWLLAKHKPMVPCARMYASGGEAAIIIRSDAALTLRPARAARLDETILATRLGHDSPPLDGCAICRFASTRLQQSTLYRSYCKE